MTKTRTLMVDDIEQINREDICPGDLYVHEITISTADCAVWWTIVYRPSTNEYFKVYSYDATNGSYHPDIPNGRLPEGITIKEHAI